jgi:O-antigen/teichoic acid export membrane protein
MESKEKSRLLRDGTIHALGLVLSSVAGLLLVPIMVRGLGPEQYGLWIASVAAVSIFGAFDLGLRLIIIRDIAGDLRPERTPILRLLLWVHIAMGCFAAAVVATAGTFASGRLHLSESVRLVAPLVFVLGACSCFFDQVFTYVTSVWAGLRRFDLMNGYSVGASILRIAAFATALALGRGLLTIAALHASISALCAVVGLANLFLTSPSLRPRIERVPWSALREPLGFGALSQAATSIASLQMPISTLLISLINGAAAVTPFTVGQKFPTLVSGLTWRISEVFFPYASRQRGHQAIDADEFLATISRWLLLLISPAALGLIVLAPALLRTWMGQVDPTALAVLRIAAASVLVETLIPGAIQLFWGASQTSVVLFVNIATLFADVLLACVMLPQIGPAGAAWATLGSTVIAVALLMSFASVKGSVQLMPTGLTIFRRVLPSVLFAIVPAYLLQRSFAFSGWLPIGLTVLASAAIYAVVVWKYTATEEELEFIARAVRGVRAGSAPQIEVGKS